MPNTSSQPKSDLQKANETLYEQNFELSIKNQTLSTLRKLYDATLTSVEVTEVAQKVCDTIVSELNFSAALISLVDKDEKFLRPIAINANSQITKAVSMTGRSLNEIAIPMTFEDNLAIICIKTKERQSTTNLLDILDPLVTQAIADEIENISGVKTVVVYPLILAGEPIGVLNIGLPKKVDDMSRAERETLEQLIDLVTLAIDRAKLYQDLKEANLNLEQLSKLKDEFVYLASHELRTPLTAIKSYGWMILNGKSEAIGPTTLKYLNVIYSSTERLINLVNEMLDLSRIESGKVQLKLEQVDLSLLLVTLKQEFAARAVERQLTLDTDCPHDLKVNADKDKLLQILENLVGNSFKFTPPNGRVTVVCKTKDKFAEISVNDTGKGIDPEDLPKLFLKFWRADNSLVVNPQSGTGLGLYITKQFVELHGGQISATSTPGVGTTFTFTIPLV